MLVELVELMRQVGEDDDDVYYPRGRRPRGENKKRKATKSKGRGLEEGASRALMRQVMMMTMMMMTFITQGGEGRGENIRRGKLRKAEAD